MKLPWFLLIGWYRIRCRHCSSLLVMRSVGRRFWWTLTLGVVVVAGVFHFLDYPFRVVGARGTIFAFLTVALVTAFLSMYFAWKDCRFELMERASS